jgi:autotransporter strand-loop-strand O-heptosyltransferase
VHSLPDEQNKAAPPPAAAPPLSDLPPQPAAADLASAALSPGNYSFLPPAEKPTQKAPKGIRFDFNLGCRVTLPAGRWRTRLSDIATGNVLFETENHSVTVNSAKRYFVPIRIEIWEDGEPFFTHDYDARGQHVLILFPAGTIGDPISWFPYAVKFQQRHGCRLTVAIAAALIPLFESVYPEISFVTHDAVKPEQFYATYRLGLFFSDQDHHWQPCDFRQVGLHRTAGYILGVDPQENRPKMALADGGRPFAEPYVCIATQSTSQAKYWNNPHGWREIVGWLKDQGYRVLCIDRQASHGHALVWNHIPYGAEDFTGDLPLPERARLLAHADFMIGLSSGLSWLAWSVGTPVVLISGFTHPTNEFETPFRVINYHACNSCWNDPRFQFDHKDFLWCPRHAGTPRQFECTRLITVQQVKRAIEQIPAYADRPHKGP